MTLPAAGVGDWLRRPAGRVLNGMRLHDVRRVAEGDVVWYTKRRRPLTESFLGAVNTYLRLSRLDVRFLRGEAWADWEVRLHTLLHGVAAHRTHDGLVLPEIPGQPLDAYVRRTDVGDDEALRGIAAAARALYALHSLGVEMRGSPWPLSHGDAVLRNVLFEPTTGTAHWIDFETRHRVAAPPAQRHADDVWTLSRSAVHHAGEALADRIAQAVLGAGSGPDVRIALRSAVRERHAGAALFRLAQAPISRNGRAGLARVFAS